MDFGVIFCKNHDKIKKKKKEEMELGKDI